MVRVAVFFILLAGSVTNAVADDTASTTVSDSKPPAPKSFVIEITRLVLRDSTSDSAAGLNGGRLDAQIRQWRESDQIVAEESISLTSVEDLNSTVQYGRRVAVVTGTSSLSGGRSSRQSQWQDVGTLVRDRISPRDGHVLAEITYESSTYEPHDDDNTPGETLTTTISTELFLRLGEQQVITSSQADDHVVLLVTVSPIGQARVTRRPSASRPSGQRPSRGRTSSSRTPPPQSRAFGQERLAGFVQMVFKRYDKNEDGHIDQSESTEMRGEISDYDQDGDGKLTSDEVLQYYKQRLRR